MLRPRWRKVFTDLFDNLPRTLLVVFSIAVGVFSVGVIAGAYVIISNDMSASYAANRPANIELRLFDFDANLLNMVRNARGVGDAEARRVVNLRVRQPGSNKWVTLDVLAVEDFENNKVNLLTTLEGHAQPGKREILLEREARDDLNARLGEDIIVQLADGSERTLKVVGIVQDPTTGAADFLAAPYGYIATDTLTYLRQPERFNRMYVTVAQDGNNLAHIQSVGADLKDKIEASGYPVFRTRYSLTNEHPLASTVNAVLGILMALGVLIVFLSSSLIANTLNALLNQHLRHIGVIKLVGGRNDQVFAMYLVMILAFGALALLIAVPFGGIGAYELSRFIADTMSFSLLAYRIVPLALVIQIAIGLLVPLIAGFVPVINGSRITVLRAISGEAAEGSSPGAGGNESTGRFDRFQNRVNAALARRGIHIPRPLLISLRNTFRRKGRLALTLFTLTMGGAIFIAVFNVRVTLHDYIGQVGKYFAADVTLNFDRPYRLSEIDAVARQVPGVMHVEGWAFAAAEALYPDGTVAENLTILAPPAESTLVQPILVAGRWVQPGDTRALAVSEGILATLPNLKPGDALRIKINGREETWQVVGLFKFIDREGIIAYGTYEYISRITNLANRSASFRIVTDRHDRPYQDQMSELLDQHFREAGYKIREAQPGLAALSQASESLDILVAFLLIMAMLTASVGSMGLAGTMGMNVMERTREIGIMRAIGAADHVIMRTVITEGVVIGVISFILGSILSFPITVLLSSIVSLAIFQTPIDLVFTPTGFVIWLGLVLVLSALASILPARNAARLTIREVLAYE
ncbi:MAG: FtsX-like permease family protein [Anaerolineales bacterium]